MVTIQNKKKNLKTLKTQEPEDLKGELKTLKNGGF
jgi:hypothetical protein